MKSTRCFCSLFFHTTKIKIIVVLHYLFAFLCFYSCYLFLVSIRRYRLFQELFHFHIVYILTGLEKMFHHSAVTTADNK